MDQKQIRCAADWVSMFKRATCYFYRVSIYTEDDHLDEDDKDDY